MASLMCEVVWMMNSVSVEYKCDGCGAGSMLV